MLTARKHLQCPFIFHACDTITFDNIPTPATNWCAGYVNKSNNTGQYRTHNVSGNNLLKINDKGELNFDRIHIGLCGIYNYKMFWKYAEDLWSNDKSHSHLSDCHVINEVLKNIYVNSIEFKSWLDIGNLETLSKTRDEMPDKFHILDKVDESIFIFDNFVIKFFHDQKMVSSRVARANLLGDAVPKILDQKQNFYKYKYVSGNVLSDIATPDHTNKLLTWSMSNLWNKECNSQDMYSKCQDFYYKKTVDRINKFLKQALITDKETAINGVTIPPVLELINKIPECYICTTDGYGFHGDFIFDNIIYTADGTFKLIDWRQDFGGNIEYGDIYYDLAKLNHNLVFNHDLVNKKLFSVEIGSDGVKCDILRKHSLVECQRELESFVRSNGLNQLKIDILTPIIWLNMAPLHEHPINLFLFYFGKYNLYKNMVKHNFI
jgi:hypothetical protein